MASPTADAEQEGEEGGVDEVMRHDVDGGRGRQWHMRRTTRMQQMRRCRVGPRRHADEGGIGVGEGRLYKVKGSGGRCRRGRG